MVIRGALRASKTTRRSRPAARTAGVQPALVLGPGHAGPVPALAPEPWARTHNPIAVLQAAANEPDRLAEHAESILERYADLEQYLQPPAPRRGRAAHRLLLRRVRHHRIAADLLGRPGRPGWRSSEGRQRPRAAAGRGRPAVSLRLLPPGHRRHRLPARGLRSPRHRRRRRSSRSSTRRARRSSSTCRSRAAPSAPGSGSPRSAACRCTCSTPTWRTTARTTAGSPATCTAATRTRAFARRSSSASAACARCAPSCRPRRSPKSCT